MESEWIHAANGLTNVEKEVWEDITKVMIAFREYANEPKTAAF
jgi:hypothetical protein